MKKQYSRPDISMLPTRCNVSTLSPEVPADFNKARRNLLIKGGMFATVGHLSLYGGDDGGSLITQQYNPYLHSDSFNK